MANCNDIRALCAKADAFIANPASMMGSATASPEMNALQGSIEDEYLKDFQLKDAAQWLDEPDEPARPLITDLIECGSCVAIVGPAKSAKTWLEIQTAVCIATGRDWFGRKVTRQTVYVANIEVSGRQYKKRLRSICKKLGVDKSELIERLYVDNLRGKTASFEFCLARAKAANAQVVIIDPFYQVFKGSERDDAQCQEAIEQMKQFLRLDMTLFMVFHAPKGFSGDRQIVDMISGSSVLVRFPENVVAILPQATEKDARVIDCSVLRDYAPPEPFSVRLEDGALVLASDVSPEVKGSGRASFRKTPDERDAEEQERHNTKQQKINDVCLAYLEKRGTDLPGCGELQVELRKVGAKGEVEEYLRGAKDSGVLAMQREMIENGKGGWKVKPSSHGGKVFISTPERIAAYRRTFEELPL